MKVATRSDLARRWHDLMDIDAGTIATGQSSVEEKGAEILDYMLAVASGKKSKSEDVMSFMLTLFEQADFIKEVQSLLGERLLSVGYDDTELEKEVST